MDNEKSKKKLEERTLATALSCNIDSWQAEKKPHKHDPTQKDLPNSGSSLYSHTVFFTPLLQGNFNILSRKYTSLFRYYRFIQFFLFVKFCIFLMFSGLGSQLKNITIFVNSWKYLAVNINWTGFIRTSDFDSGNLLFFEGIRGNGVGYISVKVWPL